MTERKELANWNIAATHYLTAGFVVPILFTLIGYSIIFYFGIESAFVTYLILTITIIAGVYFGVLYSASYIRKTYTLFNTSEVVNLSTIYFLIGSILSNSYRFFSGNLTLSGFIFMIIIVIISAPIFYVVSGENIY